MGKGFGYPSHGTAPRRGPSRSRTKTEERFWQIAAFGLKTDRSSEGGSYQLYRESTE
jgi:hypothetical protein